MASRNIANMHLFLEMKTKFPYLPEDTLRNYVFLYSQDQAKCISLLQRESENHFPHSQQFSDYRLSDNKPNFKTNGNINKSVDPMFNADNLNLPVQFNILPNNSNTKDSNFKKDNLTPIFDQNAKGSSAVHMQINSRNFNYTPRPEIRSAPVTPVYEKPFVSAFKSIPDSNHIAKQIPRNQNYPNRMMFSTTKEHIICPSETSSTCKSSQNVPFSKETETPKRHAVKLSITPALPFHHQQMNLYNNAVCATASHSSRPGRHTTSLNFQLQPQASSQYPLEISTVPTGKGRSCNYEDFGSHVQISVGAQGATFTALRLQRPTSSHNQNITCPLTQLSSNESCYNHSQLSSQPLNSKTDLFCTSTQDCSCSPNEPLPKKTISLHRYNSDSEKISLVNVDNSSSNHKDFPTNQRCSNEANDSTNYSHSYQTAPDYIQAVIKHQRAQLNLVQEELNKAKSICSNLKSNVNRVELDLLKQKAKQCSSYNADVIEKLKEENKQLRLECNCLLMEYDLCSKGQIPVGITDEDFYSNIFTGPNDCSALCSLNEKNKSETSSVPKKPTDEEDEKNSWICKKCTFNNHPALEKCEMCEISKNSGSFFDDDV